MSLQGLLCELHNVDVELIGAQGQEGHAAH